MRIIALHIPLVSNTLKIPAARKARAETRLPSGNALFEIFGNPVAAAAFDTVFRVTAEQFPAIIGAVILIIRAAMVLVRVWSGRVDPLSAAISFARHLILITKLLLLAG